MMNPPSASHPAANFVFRTHNPEEECKLHRWPTAEQGERVVPLAAPAAEETVRCFCLPVHADRPSMLFVEVILDCAAAEEPVVTRGYRTRFVVEWAGWNTLCFTTASLEPIGEPGGLQAIKRLRLVAGSTTLTGTVLELGQPTWRAETPLIPVTPGEDLLVNFLHERFWDRREWMHTGTAALPPAEQGLDVVWMYANLRYLQQPGRHHQTAYTRRMDVDIAGCQAISVWTATDVRAVFSVVLEIDGAPVRVIDRRRGLGGGDEMRAPLAGRRLTALTFELEQAEAEITEANPVLVSSAIRWVLLEKTGTDPALVGQAWGIPPVSAPVPAADWEAQLLPVGILVGREEFLRLRAVSRQPGPLHKLAQEIVAESQSHWAYRPEQYAGRYLPVDLGNQGCERRVSPADQMYHVNSCMVYGALAFALTGDLGHAHTARRGLFAAVRCTTWQGGFPSRIPCGLPGYRAPFIETAAAQCVAQCYDFLYPLLSVAERREVEDALFEKALPWLDLYLRLYGEGYLLKSNQGAIYVAGVVQAALVARRSHPAADEILARWIGWFPRMLGNYYTESGAANEGPGYWEYTTQHAAEALIAISRHTGRPVRDCAPAHLGRTMDYLVHLRSLAREQLSFLPLSDNIEGAGYNFMNSSLLFFARHYDDRNALWLWHEYFAHRPNPPGSPFFGKRMAGACSLSGLMEFLLFTPDVPAAPQLPSARRFEGCDRIFLRTGGRRGDGLFFFEGGPQTFEHTHRDKGQFILEAYGERFAADPGVVKYQDPASVNFKSTSYHNLVTQRGRDQDYRDAARAVVLERVDCGGDCDHLVADLANSYRTFTRYQRQVRFVRPHYFLVLDDVAAADGGLEWNYHSCAPIQSVDLTAGRIRLQGTAAAMTLAVASAQPLTARTGHYASEGQVLTHNLVLVPPEAATTLTLAALLVPFPLTGPEPQVQVGSTGSAAEFKVTGAWGEDRVVCDLRAGVASVSVTRTTNGGEATVF